MTTIAHLHQDEVGEDAFSTFTFENGQTVLAIVLDSEPWFLRKDVLALLDLKSNTSARCLSADEVRTHTMRRNGKKRGFALINEPGLYRLVFQSRKEEAEKIKTWVFTKVLPEIRRTGSYAGPDIVPRDPAVQELLEVQRQLLAVEQEKLDLERAKIALARFPEVSDLERGAVRGKLTQMVQAVAMIRGRCSGLVWRELYLAVKAINRIDLYAQQAAARKLNNRVGSIIQCVETWGLLDMVYMTARLHFMDEILAKPVNKRLPELHVDERLLPTAEERMAELTFDFAMGRVDADEEPGEPGSLN